MQVKAKKSKSVKNKTGFNTEIIASFISIFEEGRKMKSTKLSAKSFQRISQVVKASNDSPRVYVGTYNKYNSGSLDGGWLDLDDYEVSEREAEEDPDLYPDGPGVYDPDGEYYSEGTLEDMAWELLDEGAISEEQIENYIDMEKLERDFSFDHTFSNGFVFRNL